MAPVTRSRSLSYLPGRYLSRSPVLISQAAQPIVVKGGLDQHRAAAAPKPPPQHRPAAGRRPERRPRAPRKNLLQCYFDQNGIAVRERLRNDFCDNPPRTVSEVLLAADDDGPDSDFEIAAELMREMIAEVARTDRQLGRVAALIWRSYESCCDRASGGGAADLRAQLDATRSELRQARLKIAEQGGVIRFLNERRAAPS